jgi:ubiquinone/menaquinone biosynthesis C-methylase UbiE
MKGTSMEPSINTYVFDPESPTEMARLINQDRTITQAMGGPLSGISDLSRLKNILDLGCGPGGWVLDVAFALPTAEVEGMDISRIMVDYAHARARTQRRPNASFGVMDITQPFDLPNVSYDLVNTRFLLAVLKREDWPLFLSECSRVLRPGGLLRLTEAADFGHTTSTAVNELMKLIRKALSQRGYEVSFQENTPDLLLRLLSWLRTHNYQHVRSIGHILDYSAATDAWSDTHSNIEIIGYQMKPLLIKLGLITDDAFDCLYQQALIDLQQPTFCGLSHCTTILGRKPSARQ